MSYETDDNLSRFLDHAQRAIHKAGGINDQSLVELTDLAGALELTQEEMEAAGAQLGLSRTELNQVIEDAELDSEEDEDGGGKGAKVALVLGVFALLLGVIGGAIFFLLNQQGGDSPPVDDSPPIVAQNNNVPPVDQGNQVNQGNNGEAVDPPLPINGGGPGMGGDPIGKPDEPKQVRDPELLSALARLEAVLPGEKETVQKLKSDDGNQRAEGWKKLLPRLDQLLAQKETVALVLVRWHAKEDNGYNAEMIRHQLLKLLPPHVATVPEKASVYDNAFWAVETAVEALKHPALKEARQEVLEKELGEALKLTLTAAEPTEELKKKCGKALAELFFGELIQTAKKEPDRAAKLKEDLASRTQTYLGAGGQGELVKKLNEAIREAKMGMDPDPVKPPTPPDAPSPTANPRLGKLTSLTTMLLKKPRPPVEDPPLAMLKETVNLVHATTLAATLASHQDGKFDELAANPPNLSAYLAKVKPAEKPKEKEPTPKNPGRERPPQANPGFPGQPNPGFAPGGGVPGAGAIGFGGGGGAMGMEGGIGFGGFQGNAGGFQGNPGGFQFGGFQGNPGGFQGNPGGIPGTPPPPNPIPPMNPLPELTDAEYLALALKFLKLTQTKDGMKRYKAVEYIAEHCKEPKLNPVEAETVAEYLLRIKNDKEFEAVVPFLPKLDRYKSLYLAMNDVLEVASPTPSRMETILTSMTGKQHNFSGDQSWQKKCKAVLLENAQRTEQGFPEGDAVQLILRDLYQKQADLFGLEIGGDMTQPSDILERMIEQVADKLDKKAGPFDPAKKFYQGLPKELLAARYLSPGNDVQRLVLLQRLWLNLLGEKLAREQPDKAKSARNLCQELDVQFQEQDDALSQMWQCDHYLLRMWLLYLEPATTTAKKAK